MAMSVSAYRLAGLVCKYGVIVAISCKHLLTKCCSTVQMHRSMPLQKNQKCSEEGKQPLPRLHPQWGERKPLPTPTQTPSVSRPRLGVETSAPSTACSLSGPHTFGHLPAPMAGRGRVWARSAQTAANSDSCRARRNVLSGKQRTISPFSVGKFSHLKHNTSISEAMKTI